MAVSELIILKKIPYKESSLIVSGLNSEFGRLDFIAKGAEKISKKKFPSVDLFRIVSIEFNPDKDFLQSVYKAEIIENFDAVADSSASFKEACAIAAFVLKNTKPHMRCDFLFKAVRTAFSRLCTAPGKFPCLAFVKLAYLAENGLLPETDVKIDRLLATAAGDSDNTGLKDNDGVNKISQWLDSLCVYNGIN